VKSFFFESFSHLLEELLLLDFVSVRRLQEALLYQELIVGLCLLPPGRLLQFFLLPGKLAIFKADARDVDQISLLAQRILRLHPCSVLILFLAVDLRYYFTDLHAFKHLISRGNVLRYST